MNLYPFRITKTCSKGHTVTIIIDAKSAQQAQLWDIHKAPDCQYRTWFGLDKCHAKITARKVELYHPNHSYT